jgi:hypothetical protein
LTNFKPASKNELLDFLTSYPEPLVRDWTGICEPPLVSYNDFSGNKKWPESIVAKYHDTESYPKDSGNAYTWEENQYFIKDTE